jgi:hypothetical protein
MTRAQELSKKESAWRELKNSSAADEAYRAAAMLNREVVRGLLLISHRVYLHSLHAIAASAGLETYNSVVQETGGHFGGLVDMATGGGLERGPEERASQQRGADDLSEASELREETGESVAKTDLKRTWWGRYGLAGDVDMPALKR